MLWKLKAKETQHNESDEKPSELETGTAKTNSAESSHSSVSDSRRPVVKEEVLAPLVGRTRLTKS